MYETSNINHKFLTSELSTKIKHMHKNKRTKQKVSLSLFFNDLLEMDYLHEFFLRIIISMNWEKERKKEKFDELTSLGYFSLLGFYYYLRKVFPPIHNYRFFCSSYKY